MRPNPCGTQSWREMRTDETMGNFYQPEPMERIPAEVELEDGTHKAIKLVSLTDAGRNFDPDAEESK